MNKSPVVWTIVNLHRNPDNGGVYYVEWECRYDIFEHSYAKRETESFTPNPKGDWWVPFENLTESNILSWVHNALRRHDETPLQARKRVEEKCKARCERIAHDAQLEKDKFPWVS